MCGPDQPGSPPAFSADAGATSAPSAGTGSLAGTGVLGGTGVLASTGQALAALRASLTYLAFTEMTALTTAEQAECLLELERAESIWIAAKSSALTTFAASRGPAADGHATERSWLRWQARITGPAAGQAVAWSRRLAAHPAIWDALARAVISASWARELCGWSDLLPEHARADADEIMLAAAGGGASLVDLAGLAEEIRKRTAVPDRDDDDDDESNGRSLRLDLHYRGAGQLKGDLTPQCAEALQAVLDALGKKKGAEDTRTRAQRDHDALLEACTRLIAAGGLPERAGQPTQIQLIMTLGQLLGLPGAGDATGYTGPGPLASPGDACDAQIIPVVTGHIDHDLLERLAATLGQVSGASPAGHDLFGRLARMLSEAGGTDAADDDLLGRLAVTLGATAGTSPADHDVSVTTLNQVDDDPNAPPGQPGAGLARARPADRLAAAYARELALRNAMALLSGPAGLASRLRATGLTGPAASISLPLDVGTATDTIPPHLRRAVILRDQRCSFPGCEQRPAACQVHHVIPVSEGGPTRLDNLLLACRYHHLIAIHQIGWRLILNADGTKTAISPDGRRTLHSHSPPSAA